MATIFFIYGRTGCSCCSDDNFTMGPFLTEKVAQEQADAWRNGKDSPIGSQYAPNGLYSVGKEEAEEISGGRFIIDKEVWGPELESRRS